MAKSQRKRVTFEFPIRGVDRSQPLYRQPPFTTFDSLNLIPRGRTSDFRRNGGTRPRMQVKTVIDATGTVQRLHWCLNPANVTVGRIITVCKGSIYNVDGNYAKTLLAAAALSVNPVHSADVNGKVYLVDGGANVKEVDCNTLAVGNLALSAGLAVPSSCTLAANFMGRLVLAGDSSQPQNIFFSRALTPGDWDYSQTDALAAVALNASASVGRIGSPVVALIPMRGDRMLIACANSLYLLEGNPADGGHITLLSSTVGIFGKDAYTLGADGSVFFFSGNLANGGDLFRVGPLGGDPVAISNGRMNYRFVYLNTFSCAMAWHQDFNGLWLLMSELNNDRKELFYTPGLPGVGDDGFFPVTFGLATPPFKAVIVTPSAMVIGDSAGAIYAVYDNNSGPVADVGNVTIPAYVWLGPVRVQDEGAEVMTKAHFWTGEEYGVPFSFDYGIYAEKSETAILSSTVTPTARVSGTVNGDTGIPANRGFENAITRRVRGQAFAVKLSSNSASSGIVIQTVSLDFGSGGTTR